MNIVRNGVNQLTRDLTEMIPTRNDPQTQVKKEQYPYRSFYDCLIPVKN